MPTSHYTTSEADEALADITARLDALEAGAPLPPIPPIPPVTGPMLYGYSHSNRDRLERDSGVLVCADRVFEKGTPASWSQTKVAKNVPDRYTPLMSVKGSWSSPPTAAFRGLVASIPRPCVLIPNHEPENDNSDPAKFQAMIRTYADIVADVANPHVHLALNLMTSWAGKTAGQGGSVAYIPDPSTLAVPVGLTWDGYQPEAKAGKTPEEVFADPWQLTEDSGYPWWGVMETASETEAASWVGDVTDWASELGARALCYWPSQTSEPNAPDYYPPPSAFDEFATVALRYGGTAIASKYAAP